MLGIFGRVILVISLSLSFALAHVTPVQAARGMPGTADFGFGAILYPGGGYTVESTAAVRELGLDWLYIPISWEAFQPSAESLPRFDRLDPFIQAAEQQETAVVISISQAPAWAQTPTGPDAALAAQFIRLLLDRYPKTVQAVELFPGANIGRRWGGQPNPQHYTQLLKTVNDLLRSRQSSVFLVAGGLQPVTGAAGQNDLTDLDFLQAMYSYGASEWMPVISLQMVEIYGDPFTLPDESSRPVLRHYEKVRSIMVENHHRNGIIWITRLPMPYSTISGSNLNERDLNAQANWLSQVNLQLRGQLYIGAAFLQSINPELEGAEAQIPFLVRGGSNRHPYFSVLVEMIRHNDSGVVPVMPGKPKEGSLEKKRP